jgi:hypothetical protein
MNVISSGYQKGRIFNDENRKKEIFDESPLSNPLASIPRLQMGLSLRRLENLNLL